MKIVCGSCGAKYSIADEKVQGKVFKIRCRKCSHVIVVKGDEGAEGAEGVEQGASAFGGSSAAPEWYVVIDGEQAGPLTPDDIESYFIQGRISAESYAWRDGMPDWAMLATIETFSHLGSGGYDHDEATQIAQSPLMSSNPVPASPMSFHDDDPQEDATAVMEAEQFRAQPAQLSAAASFGSESLSAGGGYGGGYGGGGGASAGGFGASLDSGFGGFGGGGGMATLESDSGVDGDGMFASFDSPSADAGLAYQSFAGLGGGSSDLDFGSATSSPPAAAASGPSLIGQRNENSVLFSLSSLQKVEAVSSSKDSGPTTEGSGLIDIQSLASTHKQLSSGRDSDFAAAPMADNFSPGTLSMPAIMPKQGTHRNNNLLIGLVAGGILLLAGVGIAAIVVISNKDDKPQTIVQKEIVREVVVKDSSDNDKAARDAAEAAKNALAANTAPPAQDDDKGDDSGDPKSSRKSSAKSVPKKDDDKDKAASKAAPSTPEESTGKTSKASSGKKRDGIDDIIGSLDNKKGSSEKADSSSKAKPEPTPAPAANLPEKLSKPQVTSTFNASNGRFATCAASKNSGKLSGTLWVRLKIEPSGSVSSAEVDPKSANFNGTDIGSCIVGVVRGLKFPASKSDLSFSYPIPIK